MFNTIVFFITKFNQRIINLKSFSKNGRSFGGISLDNRHKLTPKNIFDNLGINSAFSYQELESFPKPPFHFFFKFF